MAIAAESPLLRGALVSLVSSIAGVAVVAEREDLDAASAAALSCDLLLWEFSGAETADAQEVVSSTPTVLLVASAESAAELLSAGARGVLWRDVDGERLAAALQAALAGATVFDDGMLPHLLERKPAQGSGVELTPREAEVLGLMAEGLSNKLIAARLGISDHTAKFHVNAVLDKLGAETRTEAVVRAARQGLLML